MVTLVSDLLSDVTKLLSDLLSDVTKLLSDLLSDQSSHLLSDMVLLR